MRVTTKGRYALRAMLNLAGGDSLKPVSVKKICEEESLSPIFLEQIFTKLKQFGLVKSIRGAGGGFVLAKDAADITVMDILEAVEEGLLLTPCCFPEEEKAETCVRKERCQNKNFWIDANNHFKEFFEEYSLARIMEEYR